MFETEKPIRLSVYIYPSQKNIIQAIAKTRSEEIRRVYLKCFTVFIKQFFTGRA
jgi:hypothetical protein